MKICYQKNRKGGAAGEENDAKINCWFQEQNYKNANEGKMFEFCMDWLWYDMIWYMIWYDMIWYDMIWYGMIWYDMIWYDMVWYGMIWYDTIWYGMIWYDMIWYGMIWLKHFLPQHCWTYNDVFLMTNSTKL